jgi:hypothetical protein
MRSKNRWLCTATVLAATVVAAGCQTLQRSRLASRSVTAKGPVTARREEPAATTHYYGAAEEEAENAADPNLEAIASANARIEQAASPGSRQATEYFGDASSPRSYNTAARPSTCSSGCCR